jgi:hypothetical protein
MTETKANKGRQRLLLAAAVLLAVLIYKMPGNTLWFQAKPFSYYQEFKAVKLSEMTDERMREMRYGKQYILANMLVQTLAKEKDVTVLLEPNNYYRQNGIDMIVPEPIVFYYYTSGRLKAVWTSSKDLYKAKYLVRITPQLELAIVPLNSKADIDKVVAEYKNYPATL